ncbi:16S rRNA pseudouridine(516) synthase [Enterococcus sp. HY326]|uniref:16S rRNA pseudouridine(516) synthase n=1 Tax=Enterococcus sp. HY326 TaxID=2971265 RepID=UPI00223FB36B|nr:16S rRNA pseudouridine(516) synthase [Enterococcus sp. HY326]
MRLDKLIEIVERASRTEIKRLLKSRQVLIDGEPELNGNRNVDSQLHRIEVAGKPVWTNHVYYLMNKPAGIVTAVSDINKKTVIDLLAPDDYRREIFPVGRLDRDTEGLVFLTDNGPLGYALAQAKFQVAKVYEAVINEEVTQADVTAFFEGIIFLDGTRCRPAQLEILSAALGESRIRLTIDEGKYHQVKKMFLARGKKVTYLKRLQLGPLLLDNNLAPGEYRSLTLLELQHLRSFF